MNGEAMGKKAQIRMSESIAIMIVFFVLLVFGIVFYSQIERRNIGVAISSSQDLKAVEVAQVFSFLPEVQCTKENIVINNCFDLMKLESLGHWVDPDNAGTNPVEQYYYPMFLMSKLTVRQIYPDAGEMVIYDLEPPGGEWTKSAATQIPVSLYNATGDPVAGRPPFYAFGYLEVEVFSK